MASRLTLGIQFMIKKIKENLVQCQSALDALISNEAALYNIEKTAQMMIESLRSGGKIMSCGNGGSMCDAMHFAEELSGKFRNERAALPALAISDPSHLSCVSNDYGYEFVFSRFVEAFGKPGDVLLGISTSGNSKNILRAAEAAVAKGVKVILLTGREKSEIEKFSDVVICTPGGTNYSDRIQELHIKCIHILIELIEEGVVVGN